MQKCKQSSSPAAFAPQNFKTTVQTQDYQKKSKFINILEPVSPQLHHAVPASSPDCGILRSY